MALQSRELQCVRFIVVLVRSSLSARFEAGKELLPLSALELNELQHVVLACSPFLAHLEARRELLPPAALRLTCNSYAALPRIVSDTRRSCFLWRSVAMKKIAMTFRSLSFWMNGKCKRWLVNTQLRMQRESWASTCRLRPWHGTRTALEWLQYGESRLPELVYGHVVDRSDVAGAAAKRSPCSGRRGPDAVETIQLRAGEFVVLRRGRSKCSRRRLGC